MMSKLTKDDGLAIMLLSDAIISLDELFTALQANDLGPGYDHRAFELMVGDYCSAGADIVASIVVDLETGRRILDAARTIIAERCHELNVATDPDRQEPAI